MIKYISIFVIGVIVGALLRKPDILTKKFEVVSVKTDTQYVPRETIVEKRGKDIVHDTTIYVELPRVIDTIQIIQDYFAKNVYMDTLRLDSLSYVSIIDTIQNNSILSRRYHANITEKVITKEITMREIKRKQLYLGISFNQQLQPEIAALIASKTRHAYLLAYSNNGLRLGYFYKLR